MTDRVGQQLGNYRLIRLLGAGGFAEVYLGEHIYLGTKAAIKLMRTLSTSDDMDNFRTEARTIANLVHPNIVRVLEFGVEDGTPFLVMDYAPNGTLRQRHSKGVGVPLTTIVPYVKQVADALQFAHDQKLIHRDIKTENMLLGRNNEVLLSDFGLALMAQSTRIGDLQMAGGTIAYIAPEQIQGKPRPASDQYSLGIIVYEWLSGNQPFQGSVNEVVSQHLATLPPPLREKVPTISPGVEQVVMKAVAKDPKERFPTVQDFAAALEQASWVEEDATIAVQAPGSIEEPTIAAVLFSLQAAAPANPTPAPAQPGTTSRVVGTPPTLYTYREHTSKVNAVTWSVGGWFLSSASDDQTVQVWNTRTGNKFGTHRGHSDRVIAVTYLAGGPPIASGGVDKTVQVWDASTGNPIFTYRGHSNNVKAVAASPDGKLIASGGDDEQVQVWDATSGNRIITYSSHIYPVTSIAWSPDGKLIASGGSGKAIQVWDAANGRFIFTYRGHSSNVNAIAWSPDSKLIASGSDDQTVQVWDIVTGYNSLPSRGHASAVTAVCWSPDGKAIASASDDGNVQVWDTSTGRKVSSYRHAAAVRTVAWSPDNTRIAFGGDDGVVQVWVVS